MHSRIKSMAYFMIALSALAMAWSAQAQELLPATVPAEAEAAPSGDSEGAAPVAETPIDSTPSIAATTSATDGELHGNVTAGMGLVLLNNASYRFGKFTGLSSDTPFFVGAADVQSRSGSRYWNLNMDNVGLDNRHFNLKGGKTGMYKFHFDYSELDSLLSNNSKTPFNGAGGATLTLPAGFFKNNTPAGMTSLAASLKSVDLGTKRKDGDAGFDYQLGQNFGLSFNFRRYLKDGTKSLGGVVSSGGTFKGVVLPEPVDYQTDEFRTGLNWRGERGQANLDYYYSRFNNSNDSLTWDVPFTSALVPAANVFPATARTSLAPDNQMQRLSLSGSYKLATTTRVTARVEKGSMTQNEAFLPYTINSATVISAPLPLGSANARIDTTLVKVDLSAQPLSKLSVHAGIRHYATDNKTPINLYQRVVNDGATQVTVASPEAQYNRPFDYSQKQYALDGSYYFGKGTTLKLGVDRDQMDYRLRAVNTTKEHTVSAKLNKRWEAGATAFIDMAQSRKRSDGYNSTREFEEAHTSQYLIGPPPVAANVYFDSLPDMRQLDIADRDRTRQGIGFALMPHPNLTLGMNISRNKDSYDASLFGLQSRDNKNGTLDATLTPDRITSISLYYARQEFDSLQASRVIGFGTKAADSINLAKNWWARTQDNLDTIGTNAKRSFMDDKLLMRLAYTFTRTSTDLTFTGGSAITAATAAAMPTVVGRRQTIDMSGTYKVEKDMDVQLGLLVELYRSNDFATATFPVGSPLVANVLTLSGAPASYRAFVVQSSLHHRF